ncbi:hypothetical protein DIPPA_25743 [Diplonema papillatum]|nr:hypothetical protein DIPPA_25743 [Diplonema papillatum]
MFRVASVEVMQSPPTPQSPVLKPITKLFAEDELLDLGEWTGEGCCSPQKAHPGDGSYTLFTWLKHLPSPSYSPCTTTLSSSTDDYHHDDEWLDNAAPRNHSISRSVSPLHSL